MLQREGTRGALEVLEHVAGGVRVENHVEQNPHTVQVLDELRDGSVHERGHEANDLGHGSRRKTSTLEPQSKKDSTNRRP